MITRSQKLAERNELPFTIMHAFCKHCRGRIWPFFLTIVMNWRWRIGFSLQIRILLNRLLQKPRVKLVKEENFLLNTAAESLCVRLVRVRLDACLTSDSLQQLPSGTSLPPPLYRLTPQTSASSSVHHGGELALVIRRKVNDESREELSCYMISDKPGREQKNKSGVRFPVLRLQVHMHVMFDAAWWLGPEWGVHKNLLGKFTTNGRWRRHNKWASVGDEPISICSSFH